LPGRAEPRRTSPFATRQRPVGIRMLHLTDQQLGFLLFPALVAIPPVIGFLAGIRRQGTVRGAIAAMLVSLVLGVGAGVAWAVAVDLRAASLGGGNPWIGHPRGVTIHGLLLGAGVGVMTGAIGGVIAAGLVWMQRKSRE